MLPNAKNLKVATNRIFRFDCEGVMPQPVLQDYSNRRPKLGDFNIPAVPMLRCSYYCLSRR